MAGDNVAINAGLALINLVKAIIELIKSASELKISNYKEKIAEKDNKIKELESKVEKVTNDKNKTEEEKKKEVGDLKKEIEALKDKCDDYKGKVDSLENGIAGANKILNEKGNQTIINNINIYMENRDKTGPLQPDEVVQITENIMEKEGFNFDKTMDKESIKISIVNAYNRTQPLVVSEGLDNKLNEIAPNSPYFSSTLDAAAKQDPKLAQEVAEVKDAIKNGRPVYDFKNKPVKSDIGKNQEVTGMTFGAKSVLAKGEAK